MSIPSTQSRPAVPRRVILFGVFLGLLLALLGLVGSHLVQQLNADYVEVVSTQLPSLALIRDINKAQGQGRSLLQPVARGVSESDIVKTRASILIIRQQNGARLDKLSGLLSSDQGKMLFGKLSKVRLKYHTECDRFLALLSARLDDYTLEVQRLAMLVADANFVDAQDELGDYLEQRATVRSEQLAELPARLNKFFFVVATLPLILAGGFFVFGFVSTLVMFYQRRKLF